jgi:hypothetical protein
VHMYQQLQSNGTFRYLAIAFFGVFKHPVLIVVLCCRYAFLLNTHSADIDASWKSILQTDYVMPKTKKIPKAQALEFAPYLKGKLYHCGVVDCAFQTPSEQSMRNHYGPKPKGHSLPCHFTGLCKDRKDINLDYRKRQEEKNRPYLRPGPRQNRKNTQECADDSKLKEYGAYGVPKSKVRVKKSLQPNAGKGVFVTDSFVTGDFITWYEGTHDSTVEGDGEYTIQMSDDSYINGIKKPKKGCGVGSLINRPNEKQSPNVEFFEIEGTDICQIAALQNIPADTELLCSYSKVYRIKRIKRRSRK